MKNSNTVTEKKTEVKPVTSETVKANIIEMLVSRQQHFIYRIQAEKEKLTAKKAKQYRQKMRRQLDNFHLRICLTKNVETKKTALTEFLAFYKFHYLLNDFSLQSITDSRNEDKRNSYTELLNIAKESLGKM